MGNSSNEQYTLLTDYDTNTAYNEAFHTLYANIRFNWDSERVKQQSILLTTPSTYLEQAAIAANVAIAIAQSGTPTVLIDADFRSPSLQQRFGSGKNAGLSDLLIEETFLGKNFEPYLQATFVTNLRLLGAGTALEQGAKLLLSSRLERVVDGIRQYLEDTVTEPGMILIHSPAVLVGADASLIGALVEQTYLTIITGHTTRSQAKQAQEQLERAHAKLTGIIMLDS